MRTPQIIIDKAKNYFDKNQIISTANIREELFEGENVRTKASDKALKQLE